MTESTSSSKAADCGDIVAELCSLLKNPTDLRVQRAYLALQLVVSGDDLETARSSIDSLSDLARKFHFPGDGSIYLDRYLSVAFETLREGALLLSAHFSRRYGIRYARPWSSRHASAVDDARYFDETVTMLEAADGFDGSGGILADVFASPHLHAYSATTILRESLNHTATCSFLGVNTYDGTEWYDRNRFGELVTWYAVLSSLRSLERSSFDTDTPVIVEWIRRWIAARDGSRYKVKELIRVLEAEPR